MAGRTPIRIYLYGKRGHHHARTIDGDDQASHRDCRVLPEHLHDRSNVRDRDGKRSDPIGRPLDGIKWDKFLRCRTCNLLKHQRMFANYAVAEDLRRHDGFNLHCRSCQHVKPKVSGGYTGDGFVINDDDDDDDTSSESDTDSDDEYYGSAYEDDDESDNDDDSSDDDIDPPTPLKRHATQPLPNTSPTKRVRLTKGET